MNIPSPRRRQTRNVFARRSSASNIALDTEIELLYEIILQKQRSGYEMSQLIEYNEKTLCYIRYIMYKQAKNAIDLFIIKLYLYNLKKFMGIFKNVNTNLDELMTKICTYLKCEEINVDRVICKQGDKGDKFYLILQGTISVLIQKEQTMRLSKVDYLKYLVLLYVHQENDLINRTLLVNRSVYYTEEKDLYQLFCVFRVFKFYLDHASDYIKANNNRYISDFLNEKHEIYDLLQEKFENSPQKCLQLLGLDELSIKAVFVYYESLIDAIKDKMKDHVVQIQRRSIMKVRSVMSPSPRAKRQRHSSMLEVYSNVITNPEMNNDYVYYASKDQYCDRLKPPSVSESPADEEVKVYQYVEVVALTEGNIFGDVALQNSSKKRTATIITKTPCTFGTLTKTTYDLCLKSTQDKIRWWNLLYFLSGPIFKEVNQNIFEGKYFNWFKQVELNKSEVLFQKGEGMKSIFFIKTGELELSAKMTFPQVNSLLSSMGVKVDDAKETKLAAESVEFHKYYYDKKHTFRFCLLKDNEIAGLSDFIISDKYFCDCVVASSKIVIFELEYNFYQNLTTEKQIKKNIDEYVRMKRKVLVERIKIMRETKLNSEMKKIKEDEKLFINGQKSIKDESSNNVHFNFQYKTKIKEKLKPKPLILSAIASNRYQTLISPSTKTDLKTSIATPLLTPVKVKNKKLFSLGNNKTSTFKRFKRNVPLTNKLLLGATKNNENMCFSQTSLGHMESMTQVYHNKRDKSLSNISNSRRNCSMDSNMIIRKKKNYKYNISRVKKIFISTSGGFAKPIKEFRMKYQELRTIPPEDEFFYENQHVFNGILDKEPKQRTRNNGLIDFLVLDKWAEKMHSK